MPKFLENKLKSEYGANSKIPYMVMNKLGAMRGNKETAKGAAMEAKHDADMGKKRESVPGMMQARQRLRMDRADSTKHIKRGSR